MALVRRLVYRLGFRPKPGSIFFSPSRDLILQVQEAFKNIKWDV